MFEVLNETEEDRNPNWTRKKEGYHDFYTILIDRSEEYGSIRGGERAPNWGFVTSRSHCRTI